MVQDASVNSDAGSVALAWERVARTQIKYHRWAKTDRALRFRDLFNLVRHPDYLLVAWDHVTHNKGARTAGVDGVTARQITEQGEVGVFLSGIVRTLRDGSYRPSPVRRVLIFETGWEVSPVRDTDACRQGGTAVAEDGAGTDFRGRLSAGLVWVPTQAARS